MIYNSPLSRGRATRLIEVMSLKPGAQALDIGCGTGAFLRELVARSGCEGLGFDIDPVAIEAARAGAGEAGLGDRCRFDVQDIKEAELEPESLDAVMCIGSTHAFAMGEGAYEGALRGIIPLLRPGGLALIGEGYWKQPPPEGYLKFLGPNPGVYRDHKGNVDLGEVLGLVPLYCVVSNDDEWDDFEWSHRLRMERRAAANPEAIEIKEKLLRSRRWRDAYLQWGRQTMGFGFYLFQRSILG